jgi:hypothetical protein
MNLAEFVEESLTEILSGIHAAQKKEGGGAIGAEMFGVPSGNLMVAGGTSGHFTIVELDVSVVAETSAGGKGGLRVWSVGVEGEGSGQTSKLAASALLCTSGFRKVTKPADQRVSRWNNIEAPNAQSRTPILS